LAYTAEPGEPEQVRSVSVNSPLKVDGAKIFLVGHGYAPHLKLTDSKGRVVFDDTVVFLPQDGNFTSTGVLKAPDASPQLGFSAILAPTATITEATGPISSFPAPDDPGLFLSAWTGDLGLDSGTPQNIYQLDTEGLERLGVEALKPGQTWTLPDGMGRLEFVSLDRWASFRIAHDPGRFPALLGALLALVGLSLSLFVRRRRIWVRVGAAAAGTPEAADRSASTASDAPATLYRVQVAGLSRSEAADVAREVKLLAAGIGGPVEREGS
jgi:cytochrome c biogenesis protein